jgi:hypothetical protein
MARRKNHMRVGGADVPIQNYEGIEWVSYPDPRTGHMISVRREHAKELYNDLPVLPELQALIEEYLTRAPEEPEQSPLGVTTSTKRRFEVARGFILELRKALDGTGNPDLDALRDHLQAAARPAPRHPLSMDDL